eukprot:2206766-Amphidinium_carterae.1
MQSVISMARSFRSFCLQRTGIASSAAALRSDSARFHLAHTGHCRHSGDVNTALDRACRSPLGADCSRGICCRSLRPSIHSMHRWPVHQRMHSDGIRVSSVNKLNLEHLPPPPLSTEMPHVGVPLGVLHTHMGCT